MVNITKYNHNDRNQKTRCKTGKYTIFEDMGFHNFRLNTSLNIRNVSYVDELRAVSKIFLFSQISNDNHPGPSIVNEKTPEYDVERILEKKRVAVTNIW